MSGDSGDKREVQPLAAAAGSGRRKASQPVNSCLIGLCSQPAFVH